MASILQAMASLTFLFSPYLKPCNARLVAKPGLKTSMEEAMKLVMATEACVFFRTIVFCMRCILPIRVELKPGGATSITFMA